MRWSADRLRRLALATGILLLAAGLRTWRLASLPPGLHHDEAFHLLRAEEIALGESLPVYIPANQGNEPLFAFLSAAAILILGPVNWAGRLIASWVGLLAVALTMRAGYEMFATRGVGLWSGLILATLFWHLDMSRWGSQPILSAAAAAGTIAALWRGARAGRLGAFILSGVALAAGLWAYATFRLFPLVPLAAVLLLMRALPSRRRLVLVGGIAAGLTALVLFAPLGLWFAQHPEWFFNRFRQVTQTTLGAETPAFNLFRQTAAVLAGLVVPGQGDHDWRHNLAGRPGLDPVQAILAVVGVTTGLRRRHQPEVWTLLIWAAVGLAPAVLTEYPPQHGRSLAATPALALLCGLGTDVLWRWSRGLPWIRIGLGGAVAVSAGVSVNTYFGWWANDINLYTAFDVGLYELSGVLRQAPDGAVLYETPVYREYPTFEFALGRASYQRFRAFNGRACLVLPPETPAGAWYGVIVAEDKESLPALQAAYPSGRVTETLYRGATAYATVLAVTSNQPAIIHPGTARTLRFGGTIDLLGYTLGAVPAAGDTFPLTLYWRMAHETAADLHLFVHVLGSPQADGNPLYAQRDAGPCDNSYPTWQWAPGEVLVDRLAIGMPADLPAGPYQVSVGWYDVASLARLEAEDDAGRALGNSVELESFEIGAP